MTQELLEQVRDLGLPLGSFVLFGSAPMGVRGIREMKDADILVTPEIFEDFRKKSDWVWEKKSSGSECLRCGVLEMFSDWRPGEWNVATLIAEAEVIEGLPFVKLEDVKRWKQLRNSEKDKNDIQLIDCFMGGGTPPL